jgi:hypothetical protein
MRDAVLSYYPLPPTLNWMWLVWWNLLPTTVLLAMARWLRRT